MTAERSAPVAGSGRGHKRKRRTPRFAFARGAALGLLVVIPAVAIAVRAAAGLGVLEQGQGLIATLRMTLVFAGLPAVRELGAVWRRPTPPTGGAPR